MNMRIATCDLNKFLSKAILYVCTTYTFNLTDYFNAEISTSSLNNCFHHFHVSVTLAIKFCNGDKHKFFLVKF